MKVTIDQALDLLKSAGVDVQLVENSEESDFDKPTALSSIDDTRRKVIEPSILAQYEDSIKESIAGKQGGTLVRMLRNKLGMPEKDLLAIKDDKERIEKAIEYYINTLANDKEGTASKIEEILNSAKQREEALAAEYEAKIADYESKVSAAEQKYIDRDVIEYFETALKDAPLVDGANRKALSKDFVNYARDLYHVKWDEQRRAAALFSKDNPNVPVVDKERNEIVNVMDLAKPYFEERGIWQTDTRSVNPAAKIGQMMEQRTEAPKQTNNFAGGPAEGAYSKLMSQMDSVLASNG